MGKQIYEHLFFRKASILLKLLVGLRIILLPHFPFSYVYNSPFLERGHWKNLHFVDKRSPECNEEQGGTRSISAVG